MSTITDDVNKLQILVTNKTYPTTKDELEAIHEIAWAIQLKVEKLLRRL